MDTVSHETITCQDDIPAECRQCLVCFTQTSSLLANNLLIYTPQNSTLLVHFPFSDIPCLSPVSLPARNHLSWGAVCIFMANIIYYQLVKHCNNQMSMSLPISLVLVEAATSLVQVHQSWTPSDAKMQIEWSRNASETLNWVSIFALPVSSTQSQWFFG